MNKVQWAVGGKGKAPGKMALRRGSLVLVSLLGWLLAMMPAHAEEPLLAAEYQPLVQKVIDAAKAGISGRWPASSSTPSSGSIPSRSSIIRPRW